jgi:uncharacterized Tic20 family protein
MQQDPNYGRPEEEREPGAPVGGPIGTTGGVGTSQMSLQDERTWSMLAHLSVLVNILSAGVSALGPVAALIVWLVYKDRSQRVAFHALQSLWNQVAWLVIISVGWIITIFLTFLVIGVLLWPVMFLLMLVPFVQGCYAAYKVNQGVDYRYPFIADMVDQGHRFA